MVRRSIYAVAFFMTALTVPVVAQAQGVPGGIERGAHEGNREAGPVGAVVGGVVGGMLGGVAGILGVDQRPHFHEYVVGRRHASYRYEQPLRVGAELPESGVTYYDVPPEYGARDYYYTVVNDHTVLVDRHTHRIVEIED